MRRFIVYGIALLMTLLIGCGEKEVNPVNFVKVQYAGMNGEAVAEVTFDYESFGNYLLAAAPEKKKKELSDILTTSFEESLVTCSLDNSKALSNGDTITVNLLWDDSLLKDYKIKFTGEKTKEIKVEGLEEYQELDAFDEAIFNVPADVKGVHIETTGASPLLKISLYNDIDKDDERSNIRYYESDERGTDLYSGKYYSSDDEVFVSAQYTGKESDKCKLKERTIAVSLPATSKYLTSFDELNDDAWQTIYDYLKEFYADHTSVTDKNELVWHSDNSLFTVFFNKVDQAKTINNFVFDRIYLVTLQKGKNYSDYAGYEAINKLIIPFSYTFDGTDLMGGQNYTNQPASSYITINNPIIMPDGTLLLDNKETNTNCRVNVDCLTDSGKINSEVINIKDHDVADMDIDMSRIN